MGSVLWLLVRTTARNICKACDRRTIIVDIARTVASHVPVSTLVYKVIKYDRKKSIVYIAVTEGVTAESSPILHQFRERDTLRLRRCQYY